MASKELSARLQYLNESSHLLAAIAPVTSKHLMACQNDLLFESNLDPSEDQRRAACRACGTIMILGWEGTVEVQGRQKRKGKSDVIQGSLVYNCHCCGRKTRHPIITSSSRSRPKSISSKPEISPKASQPTNTFGLKPSLTADTASTNSKKRPKRKYGGLSAILAKQKASQVQPGFGLDILDFIKK
ncbi:hypothetical protein BGZ60DRAFT_523623 [Tricladium varicosporioides]|nr:hypothetical protein BGZ60DRAFT_523623 [Hymenoscyphus varicosporioides]